ncbi:MAG: P1 family peptidase [Ignavibacteriales bacterium]|nr:P1 family peptidase [Ignavibacteriales bacterium]
MKNQALTLALLALLAAFFLFSSAGFGQAKPRARDLGVPLEGTPGPLNAITDVTGVEVGHTTILSGEGRVEPGKGPVRTGVTAILPRGKASFVPVFAGFYALNGVGEMTGATFVEEYGIVEGPIMITNTHSIGAVHEGVLTWRYQKKLYKPLFADLFAALPVVAETYDGLLNDINGFHVKKEHAIAALEAASTGPVAEGNVGGGTGMMAHRFKAGIGTSSRRTREGYTVGVLVQANHGSRRHLTVAGVPVGLEITDLLPMLNFPTPDEGQGSIIVIVATDAPLLPHQLKRLARRVPLGIARVGGLGENFSGDIFLAFSVANTTIEDSEKVSPVHMLPNTLINPLFEAVVQATEEAILNALIAAETMKGINGNIVFALPHDRLKDVLRQYNRMAR